MVETLTEKTAADVLAYLKATGTSAERLTLTEAFVRANPKAAGADVVEYLRVKQVQNGTVRKAGKFVHGDEWDCLPENMTPADETVSLRTEVAELKRRLQAKEAECAKNLRELETSRKESIYYKDKSEGRKNATPPQK